MSALTAAEIAELRADHDTMLPDTATVQRRTETPDGAGGQTVTWPQLAAGVACRLSAASRTAALKEDGGRLNDETTHMVAFTHGQDVEPADRVVISGTTYEVLVVRTAGAWELGRHVEAREAR